MKVKFVKHQKVSKYYENDCRTATNAKISVFIICGEAIIYLLLYNLHDCTFKDTIKVYFLPRSYVLPRLRRRVGYFFYIKFICVSVLVYQLLHL